MDRVGARLYGAVRAAYADERIPRRGFQAGIPRACSVRKGRRLLSQNDGRVVFRNGSREALRRDGPVLRTAPPRRMGAQKSHSKSRGKLPRHRRAQGLSEIPALITFTIQIFIDASMECSE